MSPRDRLAIGPTLHQFQTDEYRRQSPVLRQRQIMVIAAESIGAAQTRVILFRRRADLPPTHASKTAKTRFPSRWWGRDFVGPFIETLTNDSTEMQKQAAPSP